MKENIKNRYFSSVRLSAYNSFDDYKSNLKISKEYYIPLSILEIGLRNAINDCFSIEFGENWINSDILHLDSIKKIEEVKYRILQEQKELNQNQVISELSFGFWTALFLTFSIISLASSSNHNPGLAVSLVRDVLNI